MERTTETNDRLLTPGRYLRQRRGALALFALFAALFALAFWLYRLPLAAVAYPLALCLLLGALALALDYRRVRERCRRLRLLRGAPDALADALPEAEGAEAEELRALILALCDEEQRRRADGERRYAGMVEYYTVWAHQIKTPIAAMRLRLQGEDSALSRELSAELRRVEQYVSMVLAYLRLDSEDTDFVFREQDVDPILRRCVRRFSGEFILRRLTLRYEPLTLRTVTDEKWLAFVLEQLLSNALKYTQRGGIELFAEGDTLCIRDSGIGIAPEDLPRIFEKGFTGGNGRLDQSASGIGLYLCRRVCGRLGHTLCVKSVPGVGTTVRVGLGRVCRTE